MSSAPQPPKKNTHFHVDGFMAKKQTRRGEAIKWNHARDERDACLNGKKIHSHERRVGPEKGSMCRWVLM